MNPFKIWRLVRRRFPHKTIREQVRDVKLIVRVGSRLLRRGD